MMTKLVTPILYVLILLFSNSNTFAQSESDHSIAQLWNEELLEAIRNDLARPTVHARNLYHSSVLMYDAWAQYDSIATTFFLGKSIQGFACPLDSFTLADSISTSEAVNQTLSYSVYRLLAHRFSTSVGRDTTLQRIADFMLELGYDTAFVSTDISTGNPAALGNFMAQCMIQYGLQDGSNEVNDYANLYYKTVNPPIAPDNRGNPNIEDPNRWQALLLEQFIDQSGNVLEGDTLPFLSPEWGNVLPFALDTTSDAIVKSRDGNDYRIFLDESDPPYLDITDTIGSEQYKWGFALVSTWSSHLDPSDGVMWDISPATRGNISELIGGYEEYPEYYDLLEGGGPETGYEINPFTGFPYQPQMVPRGDFSRVLAEFWADGPDSETPPGHWFTILNTVSQDSNLQKRFQGQGPILSGLEWDVKCYLTLGGAMHDAAIAAWSHKGYYDYIRPVSALRYMADQGQSTYPDSTNYSFDGIPLIPGYIELITADDPLAGSVLQHVGKIKIYAWRGPEFIDDPETDVAGVGWIRAENWWPYQRPTFVTPPFSGYVSGHSTYSRAAADVLTKLTGDPYFPGGVGRFLCPANEFLVFEDGPSVDVELQWATYVDAANESALSRMWGGIHPPQDDMNGRRIGIQVADKAFDLVQRYFNVDLDQDGYFSFEDCDDSDPNINPGMPEVCDGLDQNCNQMVDENLEIFTYYEDNDNDGFGSLTGRVDTCATSAPQGFVVDSTDCNDADSTVFPGQAEICDFIDNNCNGTFDEGLPTFTYYIDNDQDGFGEEGGISLLTCIDSIPPGFADTSGDCNDENPMINPGMMEIAGNGIDENCDGLDSIVTNTLNLTSRQVKIYPNPSQGHINIEIDYDGDVILSLFDMHGRHVLQQSLAVQSGVPQRVSLSAKSQGVYSLQLILPEVNEVSHTQLVLSNE